MRKQVTVTAEFQVARDCHSVNSSMGRSSLQISTQPALIK